MLRRRLKRNPFRSKSKGERSVNMLTAIQVKEIIEIIHQHFGAVSFLVTGILPEGLDLKFLKRERDHSF